MSATTLAATRVPAHTLVQQRDERGRLSSLHAALPVAEVEHGGVVPLLAPAATVAWHTACGAVLTVTERTPVDTWVLEQAVAEIAKPGARVCSRCNRVGDAL